MTDQLYVASGYVVNGYTQYEADASSDLSVAVSVTANVGVIKKCDANLFLVDAFQDVAVNRIRDVSITTEAIFTELAAFGKISDYFINCEINSEVLANVHVISGGSSVLSVLVDSYVQPIRLRDGYSALQVTSDTNTRNYSIRNCIGNLDSASELSAVGTRTSDNRSAFESISELSAHNTRLKDYAINLEAFASELTLNERERFIRADLLVTTELTGTSTRLKELAANLEAFAFELTDNYRVKEFKADIQAFTSELVVEEWIRIASAQLSVTSSLAIRNERISKANSNASVDAAVTVTETHLRTVSANLVVAAANVTAFVRTLRRKAEFVMASDFTTRYHITRPFTAVLSANTSLTVTGTVVKHLISAQTINASIIARPIEFRGFDSDLTVPTSVVTVPTRTSNNTNTNVVTASMNAVDVRIRTASIHTDVVATELSAVGRIAAFFITSEINSTLVCNSQITASAKSQLAVTATQTTKGIKTSDNRTNCVVDFTSINRNIRVSRGISNLISSCELNTNVSKVSQFNSHVTVDSTAHTRLLKLSLLHADMLNAVTQTTNWIRRSFTRSSMSTIVTCDSVVRKSSAASSHLNVTAESLVWANRLKETLVDLHFNAAVSAKFQKFTPVRILPMAVTASMVANGRLFYLDMRYGWTIENENRIYKPRADSRLHEIEYEDRTFTIGI
jgi:hypothetical protein